MERTVTWYNEAKTMGEIDLGNKTAFRFTLASGEVSGWIEVNYDMVKATYGWYRTADPLIAVELALKAMEA